MRAPVVAYALCSLLATPLRAADPAPVDEGIAESGQNPAAQPGAADAVDPAILAAEAGLPPWLPVLAVDAGTDLYLTQVVAGIGAEGLLGVFGLCPPLALPAGAIKPAASALAVDWVGRERGGRAGWQVGALAASYGLQLAGTALAVGGGAGLYLGTILATLAPASGDPASTALTLGVAGTALGSLGLAATLLVARPFLIPLVWGLERDAVEDPEADPRDREAMAPAPAPAVEEMAS